jgi:hypothetical protein
MAQADADRVETYTREDQVMMKHYLENYKDKPIGDIPIKSYIARKIESGTDAVEVSNGLKMIFSLSRKHKCFFEKMLIDFFQTMINDPTLSHKEYEKSFIKLVLCMQSLGSIRTESSIQFLLPFVDPIEIWPEKIREPLLKNKESTKLILEIRYNTVSALLQPQDEKGKELLVILEEKIKKIPDEDPIKVYLLRDIDMWKRSYRGELNGNNTE